MIHSHRTAQGATVLRDPSLSGCDSRLGPGPEPRCDADRVAQLLPSPLGNALPHGSEE